MVVLDHMNNKFITIIQGKSGHSCSHWFHSFCFSTCSKFSRESFLEFFPFFPSSTRKRPQLFIFKGLHLPHQITQLSALFLPLIDDDQGRNPQCSHGWNQPFPLIFCSILLCWECGPYEDPNEISSQRHPES